MVPNLRGTVSNMYATINGAIFSFSSFNSYRGSVLYYIHISYSKFGNIKHHNAGAVRVVILCIVIM
jgi:hypothetical protein